MSLLNLPGTERLVLMHDLQPNTFHKMLAVLEQYQILSYCSFEARWSNHRMVANWSYLNLICINLNAIRQAAGQLMIHPTVVGCYE